MWQGEYRFVLSTLVQKDFKIRYRNMSLGVFWSVLNPVIMMAVLTFVFTRIYRTNTDPDFPLAVLCGLVPFNFFTVAWVSGTTSVLDNAGLIKRVPVPRAVFPIATVLSNCLHLAIQMGLLLTLALVFGKGISVQWLWLPLIWALDIVFLCGLALLCSAIHVYVRDTRYVVESANTVLFWLVPIFYSFAVIPKQYKEIYQFNPVAAVVIMLRTIVIEAHAPAASTIGRLALVSFVMLVLGFFVFEKLKTKFFEHF